MTISQTITVYTDDVPNKDTMTPDEFDEAAEDFVDWITAIAAELNTWAGQANAVAVSSNDLATSLAAANFKGNWSDLTGALAVPSCVLHEDQFWELLSDLADVTASEPADANADWAVLPVGTSIVAKTANYSVTQGQMAAGCVTLTNEGASGNIDFQLPARGTAGKIFVCVVEAHYVKIKPPAGERIYFYNNQSTAEDGYIRGNTPRTHFGLICTTSMQYTVINLQGDIKVDE
jgi:hypothetical protein